MKKLTRDELQEFTQDFIGAMARFNTQYNPKEQAILRDFTNHISSYLSVEAKIWKPRESK
ncbi:MAG TPA: hypothetical protein VFM18_22350 [Methanosarcina sp.]|nr:hypothetical protein [Methanosarcina sp.]